MEIPRHVYPGGERPLSRRTVPWIREPSFGSTLGQRSSALTSGATLAIGPADLVHQGQPDGEKSSRFLGASFMTHTESSSAKEDEHQAGYFHFCNGIDYTQGAGALERYVLSAVGASFSGTERVDSGDSDARSRASGESGFSMAESTASEAENSPRTGFSDAEAHGHRRVERSFSGNLKEDGLFGRRSGVYENGNYSDGADVRGSSRKQTIVTVCSYNAFSRSEFRARLVIAKTRRGAVSLDPSYSMFSFASKRSHTYTRASVQDIPDQFWTELAVSSLVRLFVAADDASRRVCGTVLLDDMVVSHTSLRRVINLVVSLLPKGHVLGTRQSFGGNTTAGGDFVKTAKYRNLLVDTLVRLVTLDQSGKIAADTADAISRQFGSDFDVAICRVLKADLGRNHEARFLKIVSDHVSENETSGQTALLLLEQTRFLIGKKAFRAARVVASRAVVLLPLDYEAWYNLALCYVMEGSYVQAMQAINSFPIIFAKKDLSDADHVDGIYDSFAMGFMERAVKGKAMDMTTFESFFPPPKAYESKRAFDSDGSSTSSLHGAKSEKGIILGKEKVGKSGKSGKARTEKDLGSIQRIWYDSFQYNPHLRHPIAGPFHRSPLSMATPMELSTVDQNVLRICSPSSVKLLLAAQSASNPWSSILDFDSRSTWGRTYDLVTSIIALIGWDELVYVKNEAFERSDAGIGAEEVESESEDVESGSRESNNESGDPKNRSEVTKNGPEGPKKPLGSSKKSPFVVSNNSSVSCKSWLQSLLLVIYEDLRVLIQTSNEDHNRSALSWQLIGLLGWSCKFNLKDSISSIVTSVMGVSAHGGFDYFGTVKMLEIYAEFGFDESPLDAFYEPYEGRSRTNKLLIQKMSPKAYEGFRAGLLTGHFSLDTILLCLVKLISYNLRWYCYMPDHLTTSTLMKLCEEHDALVVRSRLQILFRTHEKVQKKPSGSFTLRGMFAAPKTAELQEYEFVPSDTVMEYVDAKISWIEALSSDTQN